MVALEGRVFKVRLHTDWSDLPYCGKFPEVDKSHRIKIG